MVNDSKAFSLYAAGLYTHPSIKFLVKLMSKTLSLRDILDICKKTPNTFYNRTDHLRHLERSAKGAGADYRNSLFKVPGIDIDNPMFHTTNIECSYSIWKSLINFLRGKGYGMKMMMVHIPESSAIMRNQKALTENLRLIKIRHLPRHKLILAERVASKYTIISSIEEGNLNASFDELFKESYPYTRISVRELCLIAFTEGFVSTLVE